MTFCRGRCPHRPGDSARGQGLIKRGTTLRSKHSQLERPRAISCPGPTLKTCPRQVFLTLRFRFSPSPSPTLSATKGGVLRVSASPSVKSVDACHWHAPTLSLETSPSCPIGRSVACGVHFARCRRWRRLLVAPLGHGGPPSGQKHPHTQRNPCVILPFVL